MRCETNVRDENEGDKDMAKIERRVYNFGRVKQKSSSDIFKSFKNFKVVVVLKDRVI